MDKFMKYLTIQLKSGLIATKVGLDIMAHCDTKEIANGLVKVNIVAKSTNIPLDKLKQYLSDLNEVISNTNMNMEVEYNFHFKEKTNKSFQFRMKLFEDKNFIAENFEELFIAKTKLNSKPKKVSKQRVKNDRRVSNK